jgi:hypothetical protein
MRQIRQKARLIDGIISAAISRCQGKCRFRLCRIETLDRTRSSRMSHGTIAELIKNSDCADPPKITEVSALSKEARLMG